MSDNRKMSELIVMDRNANLGLIERKIEGMTVLTHKLQFVDRAVKLAMRGVLAVSDKPVSSPEARPGFDEIMAKVAVADGVEYEAAEIGGVPVWPAWLRSWSTMRLRLSGRSPRRRVG